jgi:glycosyltransferase involved in cell wall biosynthesis
MIKITKKVAVCVLTYNRYSLLKRTIKSVLDSTFRDFQIVVFNDRSTDRTNKYLNKLEKENVLTQIKHKKNLGQFKNANFVLNNVACRFMIFLHDDDIIDPELIEKEIELLESSTDISIVGCGWNVINTNGGIESKNIYNRFKEPVILDDRDYFSHHFDGLNFPWSGAMFNRKKIGTLRFENKLYLGADYPFIAKLAAGNKVGYIPEALMNYRIHEYQVSSARQDMMVDYEFWLKNFEFYNSFTLKNYNDRYLLKKLKKANNRTMFYFAMHAERPAFFFEVLRSRYFSFQYLTPVKLLKIIKKFFSLLFNRKKINHV